jgi:hypothetical protein
MPAKVRITFNSEPAGADVMKPGGEVLGTTPFYISLEHGSPSIEVSFALPGHKRAVRTVETDASREVAVKLTPEPAAPPPPAPVAVVKPKKVSSPSPSPKKSSSSSSAKKSPKETQDPGGLIKTIFDK